MSNDTVENGLVNQKNYIISVINAGQWELAISLLRFSEKVWDGLGYSYKTKELYARIKIGLDNILADDDIHWKMKQKATKILQMIPA